MSTYRRYQDARDAAWRALLRLRLAEGVPSAVASRFGWTEPLEALVSQGVVKSTANGYALTERGTEVCDAVMSELATCQSATRYL